MTPAEFKRKWARSTGKEMSGYQEHFNGPCRPRDFMEAGRRFLVIAVVAFWLGGFTFYASVVIHTGHRVFGSRAETGFLTQQVTHWLNFSGVIALTVLLANGLADWRHANRWIKSGLWVTWAIMAAILAALYTLHPMIDRMLDMEAHRVVDRSQFHGIHKTYMNLSTAQWAAGLLHLWLTLWIWRPPRATVDASASASQTPRGGFEQGAV